MATRKTQKRKGERKPSEPEQSDIIVKCEGSKGDEERNIKQREAYRETRDGIHVLEALKRTRGILKIGSS